MNTKTVQKPTKRKNEESVNASYSNVKELVKTPLFGVGITNATTENILEYVEEIIQNSSKNIYVVTPNPEMMVFARHHKDFQDVLNQAQIALCDGVGLYKAARFLDKPLQERIIGTNFMEKLCEKAIDWPITVGFLGGRSGVAEKTAECLLARFPRLKVAFASHEWKEAGYATSLSHFSETIDSSKNKKSQYSVSLSEIRHPIPGEKNILPEPNFSSLQNEQARVLDNHKPYAISHKQEHIDILFVAFGAPKQEMWMAEHINKVPVRVMVGVGGAFDQIVDSSLRPPTWVHSLGLGWLYRLIREPWRIKRQLTLLEFIWFVLKEKLA